MAVGTLVFGQSSYRDGPVPWAAPRRGRPQDEQAPGQHPRADPADGPARRRRGALVHGCGGSPWSSRRVGHKVLDEIASKVIRTYWSVASFQSLYARANGWTPGAGRGKPTVLDRWARGAARRLVAEVDDALDRLRHRPRRQGARRLHRRPVQLVRAAFAPPVLGRRPRGAGHPARVLVGADPAAGAVHPVRDRAGVGRLVRGSDRRSTRCIWPAGRHDTRPSGTSDSASRWPWCVGWSSSAGRPEPTRRSRPVSRSDAR